MIRIISVFEDFSFPLYEAQRKQLWWLAKELKKRGRDVRVVCFCKNIYKIETFFKENIEVKKIPKNYFWNYKVKSKIIHYVGLPCLRSLLVFLFSKYESGFITVTEANILGGYGHILFYFMTKIMQKRVNKFFVYSDFQLGILKKYVDVDKIQKIFPYLDFIGKKKKKSKNPRLLFMSHLSSFKGINEVLQAFMILRKKYRDMELVIADSGLNKKSSGFYCRNVNVPGIIWKGVVNPAEELSEAWIYLYPIKSIRGTMAVPLSLLEAMYSGTLFVSTAIGGLPEYFPKEYLLKEVTVEGIIKLIEKLLVSGFSKTSSGYCGEKPKIEIDNNETTSVIERNYRI